MAQDFDQAGSLISRLLEEQLGGSANAYEAPLPGLTAEQVFEAALTKDDDVCIQGMIVDTRGEIFTNPEPIADSYRADNVVEKYPELNSLHKAYLEARFSGTSQKVDMSTGTYLLEQENGRWTLRDKVKGTLYLEANESLPSPPFQVGDPFLWVLQHNNTVGYIHRGYVFVKK